MINKIKIALGCLKEIAGITGAGGGISSGGTSKSGWLLSYNEMVEHYQYFLDRIKALEAELAKYAWIPIDPEDEATWPPRAIDVELFVEDRTRTFIDLGYLNINDRFVVRGVKETYHVSFYTHYRRVVGPE